MAVREHRQTGYEFGEPYAGAQQGAQWDEGTPVRPDEEIAACIEEIWWTHREFAGTATEEEIEAVMTWPGPSSKWPTHPFMPRRHHVRAIQDEASSEPRRVPADLRLRCEVNVLVETLVDDVKAQQWKTVRATRGLDLEAGEHAVREVLGAIETTPRRATPRAMAYADGSGPVRTWPYSPKICEGAGEAHAAPNWEGTWEFSRGADDVLDRLGEAAEDYAERAEHDLALAICRERADRLPWNLDTLEDLQCALRATGARAQAEIVDDAIVARGIAALNRSGFDWNRSTMEWYRHDNRPFLRAWARQAMRFERMGYVEEATRIFEQLARAAPSDGLGARYEALRLDADAARWGAVRKRLKRMKDDAGGGAALVRLLAAAAADPQAHTMPKDIERIVAHNALTIAVILDDEDPETPMRYSDYTANGFDEATYLWGRHHEACRATLTPPWRARLEEALTRQLSRPKHSPMFDRAHDDDVQRHRMNSYVGAIERTPATPRAQRLARRLAYACGTTREPLRIEYRGAALAIEHHNARNEQLRIEIDYRGKEIDITARNAGEPWPQSEPADADEAARRIRRRETFPLASERTGT